MKKVLLMVFLGLCVWSANAGRVDDLTREISKLQKELKDNWTGPTLDNPWPHKLTDAERKKITESLEVKRKELARLYSSKAKVCRVDIKVFYHSNEPREGSYWLSSDNNPDFYLKFQGNKVSDVKKDTNHPRWESFLKTIVLDQHNHIIEVWDEDVIFDNRIFEINIDPKLFANHEHGQFIYKQQIDCGQYGKMTVEILLQVD